MSGNQFERESIFAREIGRAGSPANGRAVQPSMQEFGSLRRAIT